MDIAIDHTRGSDGRLEGSSAWRQLCTVLDRFSRDALVGRQNSLASGGGRTPKGGQRALNDVISSELAAGGWMPDTRVFRPKPALPGWRLSFHRDDVGIVVCTQNVGYLAQKLLTLQIAAGQPMEARWPSASVSVGVLLVPTDDLKAWSRMDGTVATMSDAVAQNRGLEGILTAPIAVVGLDARTDGVVWERTDVFPGGG